jgi:hypothetical protein
LLRTNPEIFIKVALSASVGNCVAISNHDTQIFIAKLLELRHQEKEGNSQTIDFSLFDSADDALSSILACPLLSKFKSRQALCC